MKQLSAWMREPVARAAAQFLRVICYFVIGFFLLGLLLSALGRQTFELHTGEGVYERAIYAEENHEPASRSLTVTSPDSVYVWAQDGEIDPAVRVFLVLLYAVNAVPLIAAYWILSRVFANIHRGEIFSQRNAAGLLYYGLLQLFTALLVSFLKLGLCGLFNLFSQSRIALSTGQNLLNNAIPSIAVLVAAYILSYGVSLQDEVDHTL